MYLDNFLKVYCPLLEVLLQEDGLTQLPHEALKQKAKAKNKNPPNRP